MKIKNAFDHINWILLFISPRYFNNDALDVLPRPSDMTAEEAWEIARRIACPEEQGGLSPETFMDIFGFGIDCFENAILDYTPQQVKAKIEAWEAKEKEIKVGMK